jgi:hypothetical protein
MRNRFIQSRAARHKCLSQEKKRGILSLNTVSVARSGVDGRSHCAAGAHGALPLVQATGMNYLMHMRQNEQPFQALQAVIQTHQAQQGGVLTRALYHLVAPSPDQHDELVQVMAEMLDIPAAPPVMDCETCLADMPAFLELEAQQGSATAARTYPHVWWQLWQPGECAEAYLAACALQQAAQQGTLPAPPSLPAADSSRVVLLRLCREFLGSMLPLPTHSQVLGMAMAGRTGQQEIVLVDDEDTDDGYHVSMSVREQSHENWDILIRVSPLPDGSLVLKMGQEEFRAPLDPHGHALFSGIPSALLATADAPGLMVALEPHEGSHYPLI